MSERRGWQVACGLFVLSGVLLVASAVLKAFGL